MPILRNRLVLEIARGVTGFVNLEAGLSRTAPPNAEMLAAQVAALRKQLEQLDRRMARPDGRSARGDGLQNLDGITGRLYELGYVDQTLEELHELAESKRPTAKKLAAWELCLWYADHYSEEGARRCLEYLPVALENAEGPMRRRQAAIIEAESQDILGNAGTARSVLARALERNPHADLFLARANLEDALPERVARINGALRLHELPEVSCDAASGRPPLDSLTLRRGERNRVEVSSGAKVSVIVPAYNAEEELPTALDSVLSQTWTNLEVLVVDDRSTDGTAAVAEEYARRDERVRLLRAEENGGTYVARNLALGEAKGEFVTCHDADDWSHPEKIERQARQLLDNPSVVGNNSQQARVTEDLRFYHRGKIHFLLRNASSLMFRREPVVEKIGYWDCVRFGADNEFRLRLQKAFGEEGVVTLQTGPLSFMRQSAGRSLTESAGSGVYVPMGPRKQYHKVYTHFHDTAEDLRYEFPQQKRPFPAPEPMWPNREVREGERRHLDVVLISDFRLPGGTTSSNVEEIKAQKRLGLRTGLIHVQPYRSNPFRPLNPKIWDAVDGDAVQMLAYGEKISCDVLNVRYPPTLGDRTQHMVDVEATRVNVIINQTPMQRYGAASERMYELGRCERNLRGYFGRAGVWYPIGPAIRNALHEHHAAELEEVELAGEDWLNIIDVDEWRRGARPPRGPRPRIGRHSRDAPDKWPVNREELLAAYPASGDYEVRVLGGAEAPKEVLGELPDNWHVLEFGAVHPRDFLSELDVFVYYTRPERVEPFGRVIFEAMATGVPVVLPHNFRELFGEAAIYAKPPEVKGTIDRLMSDDDLYESRVETARDYVEKHFGYTKHAERLGIKSKR